jgi:hypothetical protein
VMVQRRELGVRAVSRDGGCGSEDDGSILEEFKEMGGGDVH